MKPNNLAGKLISSSSQNNAPQSTTSNKDKDRGFKIKVGLSTKESAPTLATFSTDSTIQLNEDYASTTMFDVCTEIGVEKVRKRKDTPKSSIAPPKVHRVVTNATSQTFRPQVEIINGQIVLKESSLTLPSNTSATHEDFEEVEEDIYPTARYTSFQASSYGPRWGIEETNRFHLAIRQCGTDFSLMQSFFPNRTRQQLKKKFFREEKQHPELVKASLTSLKLPLDLQLFDDGGARQNDNENSNSIPHAQQREVGSTESTCISDPVDISSNGLNVIFENDIFGDSGVVDV